ncbi:serine/threonine protein kinase [Bermanella sp. R86510]|uniref:serine/threonine protein kinase n=1 Tax=unclassified Bermanella TaxID=2627862 RepID=UPI0037C726D4
MNSDTEEFSHEYASLNPDRILNTLDRILASQNLLCSGHVLALNSYENRVYQVGIEDDKDLIAKFYRPGRWSKEAILEEHAFALEAVEAELPVVPPLLIDGQSLFEEDGFFIALFRKQGGHSGQIEQLDDFEQMGRLLGRLHQVANSIDIKHRPQMTPQTFIKDSLSFLYEHDLIEESIRSAYQSLANDIVQLVDEKWQQHQPKLQLSHSDLHASNLLWVDHTPYMLDLDDCRLSPRIQDMWMLLYGERSDMLAQLSAMSDGYEMFLPFPHNQLGLIEVMRTMRIIHYSAWLGKRWSDPAFKQAFPWFESPRYWSDQVLTLREQFANMQEPSLQLTY